MNKELSIIIPSYKEEDNLKILLPRLEKSLNEISENYEILIVDTEVSYDKTKALCSNYKSVKHINRTRGNTYGDAIRTGIRNSNGEFLIFMDADGSHDPEFIKNLWKYRFNNDVVIASRYTDGGKTENTYILILMSHIVNITYSVVLGLRCKDVSNSFKLYKNSDIKNIKLYCNNFDIVEELLYKLKKSKGKIKIHEEPFVFKKRIFGKTKRSLIAFVLTYISTIIRLRFGK